MKRLAKGADKLPDGERKDRLCLTLSASLLFSFTLFFFSPLRVYLTNIMEFDIQFPGLLMVLLAAALACSLLLAVTISLAARAPGWQARLQAFVFALGLLFWLQGAILAWNYGPLDGRPIRWGEKAALGLLDGAVWLAVLALAFWKTAAFLRFMRRAAWALVLMQAVTGAHHYLNSPPFPNHTKYVYTEGERFDFSSGANTILLLVDCFQSDLFQEVLDEEPSLAQAFAGFTYFRNHLGGFPLTYASVPLLLTASAYDNSQTLQLFLKKAYHAPCSLPLGLKRAGYDVDLFPATPNVVDGDPALASNIRPRPYPFLWSELGMLLDVSLFRGLPHFAKNFVFNNQRWFLRRLLPGERFFLSRPYDFFGEFRSKTRALREAAPSGPDHKALARKWRRKSRALLPRSGRNIPDVQFLFRAMQFATAFRRPPSFKYYHLMGLHEPFRMNERLEAEELPATRAGWKRLVRGELRLLRLFFDLLEELGIYDDALILVMGDHGHPRGSFGRVLPAGFAAQNGGASPLPAGVIESATPLLLVKRRNSRGGLSISDAPVSIADIPRTVFTELGIAADCSGASVFSIPEGAQRRRFFYHYNWTAGDWQSEHLPPLHEYRVDGHCWLSRSWQATGRVLRRP